MSLATQPCQAPLHNQAVHWVEVLWMKAQEASILEVQECLLLHRWYFRRHRSCKMVSEQHERKGHSRKNNRILDLQISEEILLHLFRFCHCDLSKEFLLETPINKAATYVLCW